MANKTITTAKGQTVFDIALQHYGSLDKLSEVFKALGDSLGITDEIPPQEITLQNVEANIVNEFLEIRRDLATAEPMRALKSWRGTTDLDAKAWRDGVYLPDLDRFVIVGDSGAGAYSDDAGETWTSVSLPVGNDFISVAYGNGILVAINNDGSGDWAISTNGGETWSATPDPAVATWGGVTFGKDLFVAVAGSLCYTSPDGVTWTSRTIQAQTWTDVVYGNSLFVAVGSNAISTSPDGLTWTARTPAESNLMTTVTYSDGVFMAFASNGTNRNNRSKDGITWTTVSGLPVAASWQAVAAWDGVFIVTRGGGNGLISEDLGLTWSLLSSALGSNDWEGIVGGSQAFIALATDLTSRIQKAALE